MYIDHNVLFSGDYISALRGCCPFKFLHALEIDQGLSAHHNRDGVPQFFNHENFKIWLKCSVWALITSRLVGIYSPNFSRPRDELWSTYWPTRSTSYTAIWHKSIRHVFLLGLIRQLPLLREEFRLSKFTVHSDLRRRAASRLALPNVWLCHALLVNSSNTETTNPTPTVTSRTLIQSETRSASSPLVDYAR